MDAKELMIRDLVLYKDKPIIVFEIDEYYDRINTEPDGYNAIRCIEASEIKPIPLTDKIFEKNEFYYENNVGYVLEYYNYEIIYDMWENELRILKDREQILKIKTFDKMCVHELQHALKLCGINKEIEL